MPSWLPHTGMSREGPFSEPLMVQEPAGHTGDRVTPYVQPRCWKVPFTVPRDGRQVVESRRAAFLAGIRLLGHRSPLRGAPAPCPVPRKSAFCDAGRR